MRKPTVFYDQRGGFQNSDLYTYIYIYNYIYTKKDKFYTGLFIK